MALKRYASQDIFDTDVETDSQASEAPTPRDDEPPMPRVEEKRAPPRVVEKRAPPRVDENRAPRIQTDFMTASQRPIEVSVTDLHRAQSQLNPATEVDE